MEELDDKL